MVDDDVAGRPALPRPALARAADTLTAALRALAGRLRARPRLRLAREVLLHWAAERRTIRQGFLALGLCLSVTLLAGVLLGAADRVLERLPGLLVLVPAAIGMRGAIFGALGARLGTGMLTGQFDLTWRRRSFTGQNVEAAGLLTLATAGLQAVLAWGSARLLGAGTLDLFDLTIIAMTGALLSSLVVLVVVLVLARNAQARSWDMDAIGVPVITATADVSTIPALLVGTLLIGDPDSGPIGVQVAGGVLLAVALAAAVVGLRSRGPLKRRIVRESVPALTYTAVMGILAGTVLQSREETLEQALLVAVPPFVACCGAIGGILSARLSSQLHLGLLTARPLPQRRAGMEGSLSLLFGVVAFAGVGVTTAAAAQLTGFASPGALRLGAVTLTGGLLAVGILFVVAYYAATASYRFGLDPDNVGIPVVTSSMDFLGILCLTAGIAAFGGT